MSNKIIVMTRGDTLRFNINLMDCLGNDYIMEKDDTVYFGLMDPHQLFENALVKKRFTCKDLNSDGSITVTLESEDTIDLFPSVYYYAVKLHKVSVEDNIDAVVTIVNKTKFIIND